jgi:hypothetical protein
MQAAVSKQCLILHVCYGSGYSSHSRYRYPIIHHPALGALFPFRHDESLHVVALSIYESKPPDLLHCPPGLFTRRSDPDMTRRTLGLFFQPTLAQVGVQLFPGSNARRRPLALEVEPPSPGELCAKYLRVVTVLGPVDPDVLRLCLDAACCLLRDGDEGASVRFLRLCDRPGNCRP